MEALAACQGL